MQLVASDQKSIASIYRANGFKDATVTSSVKDLDTGKRGEKAKVAEIAVTYKIDEGLQQKFGDISFKGIDAERQKVLEPMLAAREGQPFSLVTLSGDRDVILGYYLSNGYDQARVEVSQDVDEHDKTLTDIGYVVTEGPQVYVGKVLRSGIVHTKPKTVEPLVTVPCGRTAGPERTARNTA